MRLEDITHAVLDKLTTSCSACGITSDIIDKPAFSCYPESPIYVTYRARLEGTSETDSGSLIFLIEEWVSGGASIIVTGVLMTVDSECSVFISSLSEGECSPSVTQQPTPDNVPDTKPPTMDDTTNTQTPSTDSTSSMETEGSPAATNSNTVAIVGGVVSIVLVLIIAITIVIVALVMKNRRKDPSIKNTEK